MVRVLRSVVVCLCALLAIFAFISSRHTTVGFRKYPNRIPVRFWHMWSAEWKDVVDRIVDRYNRSQDKYEVIALSVPSGGDAKFLQRLDVLNPVRVIAGEHLRLAFDRRARFSARSGQHA